MVINVMEKLEIMKWYEIYGLFLHHSDFSLQNIITKRWIKRKAEEKYAEHLSIYLSL